MSMNIPRLREKVSADFECRFPSKDQVEFDVVRKAMLVEEVLHYLGVHMPEAREIVGEVDDLVRRVKTAKEVSPMLQHWL